MRGMSNNYLVSDGTLIDAGVKPEILAARTRDLGIEVKMILITHYHVDHVRYLKRIIEMTKAKLVAPALDAAVISGREKPRQPPLMPILGLLRSPAVNVDVEVMDGDEVNGYKAIHMPGHTPGSTAYLLGDLLFSGDAVVSRHGSPAPPPRLFSLNPGEALRSILRLRGMRISNVYPGHGDPFRGEKLEAFIDSLMSRTGDREEEGHGLH